MKSCSMDEYDVIVVGAGHAGCEAALASARLGKKTLLLAINLESVAMMPCNPSIGGTGKGHLVREIDALGGEMGINIDKTFIQSKMLNTAKGSAVHSLRAQADKQLYHQEMKKTAENQENLDLKQEEATDIIIKEGKVQGVITKTLVEYKCRAVILATGTFLRGRIFIGSTSYDSGPNGLSASIMLADNLKKHGIPLRRFKTGTPARALGSSVDKSKMKEQKGDDTITPFSFMNDDIEKEQVSCWLTYTNEKTHEVIRENLEKSALYGGYIEGIGPRYCPSIEDKVNRFSEKKRHQLFVEPEGTNTDEVYLQGMATSLPKDIQEAFYKTIAGLEKLKIVRPGYAIEYDCIDPRELKMSMENRSIENLFCAGQLNGSSGYEEAAAQGIMAGINAVLKIDGKEPFILDRSEAYIGVLIDDLVTKGTSEPYRIMTSRAEYRLVLRQDNADIRLTGKSYRLGLASQERYERVLRKKKIIEEEERRFETTRIDRETANTFLNKKGGSGVKNSVTLSELLKRPEVSYEQLKDIDQERPKMKKHEAEELQVRIKYKGYIEKQQAQIERFRKTEHRKLDENMNYREIQGIREEAKQKLEALKPLSLGQASRISGVSPADINVIMIWLEKKKREKQRKQ